jgi:hypothetical protein
MLFYREELLVLGGEYGTKTLYSNEIWSTVHGDVGTVSPLQVFLPSSYVLGNWQVSTAPWSSRGGHSAVELEGELFIMGGNNGDDLNDVWSLTGSPSSNSWLQKAQHAGWTPRSLFGCVTFCFSSSGCTILVIGGVSLLLLPS